MKLNDEIVERFKSRLLEFGSLENALTLIRETGLSKVQSMHVLIKASGKSLQEAKELVHFSDTWSDVRASDEQLHQDLVEGLTKPEP